MSEQSRKGGFSHAAFAGEDQDFVSNIGEAGSDEGEIRIWSGGKGRGAYGLIGAAGAGGGLSRRGGGGTGAVGWGGCDERFRWGRKGFFIIFEGWRHFWLFV